MRDIDIVKFLPMLILVVLLVGIIAASMTMMLLGWGAWGTPTEPRGGGGRGMYGETPRGGPWSGVALNDSNIVDYVDAYAKSIDEDLEVKVVEKYSNNYYVIVWDGSRGVGAFELIVSPSGSVHPEPQSMMWNTLYGMHARYLGAEDVSVEQARSIARDWVEANFPGARIMEEYKFPGYYTFHFRLPSGEMQMLSVNAYTGQVWFHSWHGRYIASVYGEEHEE